MVFGLRRIADEVPDSRLREPSLHPLVLVKVDELVGEDDQLTELPTGMFPVKNLWTPWRPSLVWIVCMRPLQ